MENLEKEQKKDLDEQLNELENIFSDLLIDLDEIKDIVIEDIKDKEININKNEEGRKDLLEEREVQNNIKDINQGLSTKH